MGEEPINSLEKEGDNEGVWEVISEFLWKGEVDFSGGAGKEGTPGETN